MSRSLGMIVTAVLIAAWLALLVDPRPGLAAVEPSVGIRLIFEPGCEGNGTLELFNESKGVVANRVAVIWSGPGPLRTEGMDLTGVGGAPIDLGDRLVVRLLSRDGRVLFSSRARQLSLGSYADYEVAARLQCSQIPYRIAAPATSTVDSPRGSGGPLALLGLSFGLALASGWTYVSRRHGRQPAPRNTSVSPRASARRGC